MAEFLKWINKGKEVVDSLGEETEKVHPYSSRWPTMVSEGKKNIVR